MAAPSTIDEFVELIRKSGVVDEKRLTGYLDKQRSDNALPGEVGKLAGLMVRDGILTHFQAEQFLLGKWRRFTIGKYKVLERLGAGGMGSVYLCEHRVMRHRVAVKVLPTAKAESQESSALERFYREARAVAALNHPNIVRAFDIDQDEKLHFLVMEYIDGASLQEIVKRHGPLDIYRAAHYIAQAAMGLAHAHQTAQLVHRDIKPGNILVDRNGVVKVLDMGLARFFNDEESLITKKYDENVLGTADYLAPEQALDSHNVDVRADIYSLGATFYFCLTGNTPFNEGTVAQKLIWHQTRQPKPVQSLRGDVPDEMAAIIDRMMAKEPAKRYSNPAEIAQDLVPWTQHPIDPPPEKEMPRLSPAATGLSSSNALNQGSSAAPGSAPASTPGSGARKWEVGPTSPSPSSNRPAQGSLPTAPRIPAGSAAKVTGPAATPNPARAKQAPAGATAQAAVPPAAKLRTTSSGRDAVPEANPNLTWEALAPETPDPTAHLDTAPQTPLKRPKSSVILRKSKPQEFPWKIVGLVSLGAVLLLLTIWAVLRGPSRATDASSKSERQANPLYVTKSADQPNSYRTLREAYNRAGDGDRIVVLDDLEESLILEDARRPKDVTIEAGNPNQRVRWFCPAKERRFIVLSNLQGFCLKGFALDGRECVNDLITISGACPRLVLADLQLQGCKEQALVFWNCTGKSDKERIELKRLRFTTAADVRAALVFNVNPNVIPECNDQIDVAECRFEGPYNAAVRLAGPALNVNLHRNRFYGSKTALLYTRGAPRHQIQLTLDSNTFCDIHKTCLQFEGMPLSDRDNRVVVKNNLFFRVARLGEMDEGERLNEKDLVFQFITNVRDGGSKEGNLPVAPGPFPAQFSLDTDLAHDGTFLRYPKTSPLIRAGLDHQPVGVPPEN
jgi:serine/threonine protein kinase